MGSGTGESGVNAVTTPVKVAGISNAVDVASGYSNNCVVLSDGGIVCMGDNRYGQLGNGQQLTSTIPARVVGIDNGIASAIGWWHTCAVLRSGLVQCWGQNTYGQLGDGTTTDSTVPVTVKNIDTAVAVAVGSYHSCAMLDDGAVKCWGMNGNGQLGNGVTNAAVVYTTEPVDALIDCKSGQTLCNAGAGDAGAPVCADLQTNPGHCGDCANACSPGQTCSAGQCQTACQPSETLCQGDAADGGSDYCINPLTDSANCGGCGQQCESGMVCFSGRCTTACPSGQTLCSTQAADDAGAGGAGATPYCANLQTDTADCGCCGNFCRAGQACRNGRCEDTTPFGFFVFGDPQVGSDAANAVVQVAMNQATQIDDQAIAGFSNGDLMDTASYGSWDLHDTLIAAAGFHPETVCPTSFGARKRYFATVGDHDIIGPWLAMWNQHLPGQPSLGPDAEEGIYYSLTYANAFFVMLDSEHVSPEQTRWLESALGSTEAQNAQLKFMFLHEPVYSCISHHGPRGDELPWVDLAERYGVDVVFTSHTHMYTRSCPRKGGPCASDGAGVVFVETGSTGAPARGGDITTWTVDGTDATGNPRSDSYNCVVGEDLEAAGGLENDFCHVRVEGCQATLECYVVAEGNTTPFDTWTLNGCG
jgi:hypothetical protein